MYFFKGGAQTPEKQTLCTPVSLKRSLSVLTLHCVIGINSLSLVIRDASEPSHTLCTGVGGAGAEVGPGESFVYTWQLLEGPSSSDPACIPYLYYSGTNPIKDTSSGLVGPLLVCKRGSLGSSGVQVRAVYLLVSSQRCVLALGRVITQV